ncbi:ribonuclease III domain-containing protein [Schizophyllum amplum]|uniref:Large ribosomal subunit protein mL44 n=1 Tax=Schizophyllum amplum TaxID=97359 RepID=A0A550CKI8_9AGAR|nr:ribonuclease III domain-containing protein [Auriculariopsis ampla]
MRHVQRRLASTAARALSVAPSQLPRFPPKDAVFENRAVPKPPFQPEAWAAAQPPPRTALSAFAHRIGLGSVLTTPDIVQQACTHSSFVAGEVNAGAATNAQLEQTGNALMGLFASEYLAAKYPYLPTRVLKAAVTAHVGPLTCANVAQEMGPRRFCAGTGLSCSHNPAHPNVVLHTDALASIPRALTALIYQNRSLPAARHFVHSFFLSRHVDLRSMLKFRNPKWALLQLVRKFDRERPVSRLLKETGRFSNSPVYLVGVFSGEDKLGEGFGSSLKMAEYRAAEDALLRVYLTQRPPDEIQLPTSTFPAGPDNVFTEQPFNIFQKGPEQPYTPPDLVVSEIMYESGGRSAVPRVSNAEAPSGSSEVGEAL